MIRRALDFRYRGADRGLEVARFPLPRLKLAKLDLDRKYVRFETCWTKDEHFRKSVVDVLMPSNFSSFYRRGPDNVTEELVAALSGSKSYEFKALFSVIHAALRARKAAGGGEEMLRLRTYEKLQNLVRVGQVKKTGKKYKGVAKALLLLSESLKEYRKNGPSFPRRLPLAPKPL
jgi:hypothetical protein